MQTKSMRRACAGSIAALLAQMAFASLVLGQQQPAATAPTAPAAGTAAPTPAAASSSAQPAPAAAAAAPPSAEPATPAPEAPPSAEAAACFPSCRSGFLCSAGQCISACNPPCAAGETCTAAAECVTNVPAPPPSYLERRPLPPPPPPPAAETGVHTHDGFLLRAALGFGGGTMSESYRGDLFGQGVASGEIDYAGGGFRLSIDVGGSLNDALSVHGRLSLGTLDEPSMMIDGADYATPRGTTVSATLVGVGLTYVIMPLNLYFAGVVGIAGITARDDDPDTENEGGDGDAGPGLELDVGKEWWLGSQLGLGVALRLSFAASDYDGPVYDSDRTWLGAGLVCSLTYQ
jgi:hypothetical protein